MPFAQQLIGAIRGENLVNVREILAQEEDKGGGHAAVTDDDIHEALYCAAQEGSVGACRLLWGKLSRRGKRVYFATTTSRYQGPLHMAARSGHLEVVRLFIKDFKMNINQTNYYWGETPLYNAVARLEIARYLLENGANVNQGGSYSPLWLAIFANYTEVSRLLLIDYRANPNLNRRPAADEEVANNNFQGTNTDHAIIGGNSEILRMLLECGAFVVIHEHGVLIGVRDLLQKETSLNMLLSDQQKSLETKLTNCRILIAHAREDHATAAFMQASLEFAVMQTGNEGCCQILLEAGIDRRMSMYCAIQAENLSICQLLVREYQVDPFLQQEEEDDDDSNETTAAVSPFLVAARLPDTSIFEYFLDHWNERFSSSTNGGGKNSDGDYPLHVVCCDPRVSLQAIQLLVNRQADALAVVDGEQGLLPFHFAANWGASLDVIYYLINHCPDALRHGVGSTIGVLPAAHEDLVSSSTVVETSNNDDDSSKKGQADAACAPGKKKKAKTTH